MFETMTAERRRLVDTIIQLVYFMRGAIQYSEMYGMTLMEREAVASFVEGRLESERGKPNPQY